MKRNYSIGLFITAFAASGCPGDDTTAADGGSSTGETSTSGMPTTTLTTMPPDDTTAGGSSGGPMTTTGVDSSGGGSSSGGPIGEPVEFFVRIENISNEGVLPTAFSPGVWANHDPFPGENFFVELAPEPGEGLEALAEDGDPTELAMGIMDNLGFIQTGVFDTPVMSGVPGPILPGDYYEFTFIAEPPSRLSLATMLGTSNDLLMSTGPNGLSLFVGNGQPQGERDVTSSIAIWDIGTEANQAPNQGPNQPGIGGPGVGPTEAGELGEFASSTRAIPLATALLDIDVQQGDGMMAPENEYTITFTNISGTFGTMATPLSPIVFATHDDTFSLFSDGAPASTELEALAEDGITAPLELALGGNAAVGGIFVVSGPGPGPDPILPGDSVSVTITADAAFPQLSFASMLVESNDAFLAVAPAGVALMDAMGLPRDHLDIRDDIWATLGAWDAGTEENQVPGAGLDQPLRQGGLNTGAVETVDPTVHRYFDATNDLAGDNAGGFLSVAVNTSGGGGIPDYTITITNTSDTIAYTGALTPTVWALHDDTVTLFDAGVGASAGIELLAEDGDPSGVLGDVMGAPGVAMAGVADTPVGGMAPGPLLPGESYEFTVTPDATNRFLSFASMIVPSNDTFAAPMPGGVELVDAMGVGIDAATVEATLATLLRAWDAGTENNQAGAAGVDMAPVGMPNTGAPEGLGIVRGADDDTVWPVPDSANIIRVTVGPVRG